MFSIITRKLFISLLVPIAVGLSFISQTVAQDPPNLIVVSLTQLKPGMIPVFQELHREVVMPNQRANGFAWRLTQQTIFGDSFQVSVSIPLENFALIDSFQPIESELSAAFLENAVEWQRLFVLQSRAELSIAGGQGVQPFRRMVRIQVKQGKIPEFEQYWIDTIIPAMTRSGVAGYQLFQTIMGGPQGEYYGGLYFANLAELDGFNITGGLSDAESAQLQTGFGELIDELDISFIAVDPELTYGLNNTQQ
jgi:hypothetical protein